MKRMILAATLMLASTAAFAKTDALSLIPSDAVTVGVVRLNQVRTSPLASALLEHTDHVSANGDAEQFLHDAGLDPMKDVDTIVVATSPRTSLGKDADIVVLVDGRFNVDRLTSALVKRGATRRAGANGTYFVLPEQSDSHGVIAFPDSHQAILGGEAAVNTALATRARGGSMFATSLLGANLNRVDTNATAWALVDITRAQRLTGAPHVPSGSDAAHAALATAVKNISTIGLWATDTGDALKLGAFGLSNDSDTLELVEDAVRGALSAMRLAVKDSQPDLVSALRAFDVERSAGVVRITGTVPAETLKRVMAKHHDHSGMQR